MKWVLALLTFAGASLAADGLERPLAVIVEARGSASIRARSIETAVAALPGKIVFSGDRVISTGGTVKLAFCPTVSSWILDPGAQVEVLDSKIRVLAGHIMPGPKPSFCELPMAPRMPEPAGGSNGQASDGLPRLSSTGQFSRAANTETQATLSARVTEIARYLTVNPNDLLARIAQATRLEIAGLEQQVSVAFHQIGGDYEGATFSRTFEHTPAAEPPSGEAGTTFALLIGISSYKYTPPIPSLMYANKDAELFSRFLQSERGGRVDPTRIRLLRDKEATRAAIDQAVRDLSGRARNGKGKNTLVLFVAGHGGDIPTEINPTNRKILKKEPYILTYETNAQDPKTTGYPMAEFARTIATAAGVFSRVLVFVDVCHANEIGPIPSGRALEPAVRKVFSGQSNEFGMMLATQTAAFESDYFGEGHGVFTFYVIQGWNGAAESAANQSVQFVDLRNFVQTKVSWATNNQQVPETVAPTPNLILIDRPSIKKGITLVEPLKPLPLAITRQRAKPPTREIAFISSEQTLLSANARDFDEALAVGRLLPEEQGNAVGFLAALQNDPTVTPDAIEDLRGRLRVALEDKGQETILRYLEGDQIGPTKADFLKGARYFEEALRLAPDAHFIESRMLFCQGRALIFDHKYDQARALLEKSVGIDSARAYSYNALGIIYLEQIATTRGATFEQAIHAFHDAIRFAPNWAYPRHNLALAFSEQGNYSQALNEYAVAMEIAPHYSYLPYNLGLLYQKLRDYPEAERYYRRALEIAEKNEAVRRPPPGEPWKERAVVYNALGALESSRSHWSKAKEFYESALRDDCKYVNARHNLALLLSKEGSSPEAVMLWEANLKDEPEDLPTLFGYAAYLAREGNPAPAIRLYQKALKLREHYPGVRRKLAELLIAQNNIEDALKELCLAFADQPDSAELLTQIANLEARLGNSDSAARDRREASELATSPAKQKHSRQRN